MFSSTSAVTKSATTQTCRHTVTQGNVFNVLPNITLLGEISSILDGLVAFNLSMKKLKTFYELGDLLKVYGKTVCNAATFGEGMSKITQLCV